MNEVRLSGGRTTPGVVRVGETVRRPPRPNAEFVRSLLRYLEMIGFDGAPRFLGTDEKGREILTYIEGQVPADLGWYGDGVLVAAAKLIRQYHDATATLLDSSAAKSAKLEIVCHNDLSPCNFVFRDGLPAAIIDFDAVAPGTRYYDLAYAAWLWLDIGNADIEAAEQRRRLELFVEAYGANLSMGALVKAMMTRQRVLIAEGYRCRKTSMLRWATNCLDWTSANLRSEVP